MNFLACVSHLLTFNVLFFSTNAIEEGDKTELYFVKDDGMNTKFPPKLSRSMYDQIPIGHLRSLGYQRHPEGSVEITKSFIQPKEFFTKYVLKNIPLVIKGAIDDKQPIRATWNDERLKKMYGKSKIWVIKRHEKSSKTPTKVTLERFLDFYKLQDIYIASTIPEEFLSETTYPKFMKCGPIEDSLVEAELWMAYGGTGSLLHYHGDHQVHCMADGRKDFILIENKHKNSFKMVEKHPFTGEGYSELDTEMINMFKEKQIASVPWIYATIEAGDCLFIPAGYIHQVRSYGRSLSYNIQFASIHNKTITNCDSNLENNFDNLSQYNFIYTERDGIEQLKNTKLTNEDLRSILIKLIRTASILPYERFQYFYNTAIGKVHQKMPSAQVVFNNIDLKGDGFVTLDQILNLPGNQLNKISKILNSIHKTRHDEL